MYILTQDSQINPCLHLAPPVRNPPEALHMLCGGHQPLCHTEIFTRPFRAVFSLIHLIFSVFHFLLNFSAYPPLLRAVPIHHCPPDYSFIGHLFLLLTLSFPASFPATTLAAQDLHCCPHLGCVWGAVLTDCAWTVCAGHPQLPAWAGNPQAGTAGPAESLQKAVETDCILMNLSDSLGNEAKYFMYL